MTPTYMEYIREAFCRRENAAVRFLIWVAIAAERQRRARYNIARLNAR